MYSMATCFGRQRRAVREQRSQAPQLRFGLLQVAPPQVEVRGRLRGGATRGLAAAGGECSHTLAKGGCH